MIEGKLKDNCKAVEHTELTQHYLFPSGKDVEQSIETTDCNDKVTSDGIMGTGHAF